MTASSRRTPAARKAGVAVRIPSDLRSRLPASNTTASDPWRRMWHDPSPTSSMIHSTASSRPDWIASQPTAVQPTAMTEAASLRTGQSRLRHHATAATATIIAHAHPTRPISMSGTCHRAGVSAIQSTTPVSQTHASESGPASRSSTAATAATARPFAIVRPPSGIAMIESGSPSHENWPKCTMEMGVTTSHTAIDETIRPRIAPIDASPRVDGASSSWPYHRCPSGVAAQRRASTAPKVSWNPGSVMAIGSAASSDIATAPSSDPARYRRPHASAIAPATATKPARTTLGSSSTTTRYAPASPAAATAVRRHGPPTDRITTAAPSPSTAKLKPEMATRCESPLRAKWSRVSGSSRTPRPNSMVSASPGRGSGAPDAARVAAASTSRSTRSRRPWRPFRNSVDIAFDSLPITRRPSTPSVTVAVVEPSRPPLGQAS